MYFYKKSIIFDLSLYPNIFCKVQIINNNVSTSNLIVKYDIEKKIIDMKINLVSFYVSLSDYKEIEKSEFYLENLPIEILPVYKPDTDILIFLNFYNNFYNNNKIRIYETNKFTVRDYIFNDKNTCIKSVKYETTNPKFKNFICLFYHAGDWADFERFGLLYVRTEFMNLLENFSTTKIPQNLFVGNYDIWIKYKITLQSIIDTGKYLFEYMKKGVLVGIKNNKLAIYLPFSNNAYINDFYDELYFDIEDKKLLSQFKQNSNHSILKKLESNVKKHLSKLHLPITNIHLDRRKWVANDCFFRMENYEGDKSEALYEDLFVNLCANRKLPDCVFFLNLRDHPVLKKDLLNSYTSITNKPLNKKYVHENYTPILSPCSSNLHADIPMITQDDWLRISQKIYPDDCGNGYINSQIIEVDWDKKKPIAIFRGSATGCGITPETNIRLKATLLSNTNKSILDAGITSFNRKIKKSLGKPLELIDIKKLGIKKANFIDISTKSQYKYILTLDGHVSAFRLGHEFSLKSLIILPNSSYTLWFSHLLIPFTHYVPVLNDLSNLITTIEWCKSNDDKCKEIAINGYNFYMKYLREDGVYDYMQNLLIQINSKTNLLPIIKSDKRLCIITIYRDSSDHTRLEQKRLFEYWMIKMCNSLFEYDIILVEQNDTDKFNIGKLKNIGFDYSKKINTYDNYIFIDIDTLPDSEIIKYFYKITNGLNALATKGTRYEKLDKTNTKPFLGACIACTSDVFIKLNGYGNEYSEGWGGEDDNLIMRAINENITIYNNKNGAVIDIEETSNSTKDIGTKLKELKNDNNYDMQKYERALNYANYKENGLCNLEYKIIIEHKNNNFHHIKVDLLQKLSENKYPSHYKFKEVTTEKYKQYIHSLQKVKQEYF